MGNLGGSRLELMYVEKRAARKTRAGIYNGGSAGGDGDHCAVDRDIDASRGAGAGGGESRAMCGEPAESGDHVSSVCGGAQGAVSG